MGTIKTNKALAISEVGPNCFWMERRGGSFLSDQNTSVSCLPQSVSAAQSVNGLKEPH